MDETPKKKSLSEISHLFLSSVRDNATGGIRPRRVPPGSHQGGKPTAPKPDVSIDLTPDEFAKVYGGTEFSSSPDSDRPSVGPVSAVICSQFNGHQLDRVKEYARHLAAGGERIGLIEVDSAECRLMCFERAVQPIEPFEPTQAGEPREMAEALDELACDIDRWILLLPSPRISEARVLLRQVNHWVLLSTCDHDGVVSCYRAIKGLVDTHRPRLTLALLNAVDQAEAAKVYRKIAGVCEQFLNWKMDAERAVEPVEGIAEHLTLVYRPTRERTAIGPNAHWQIVANFLARSSDQNAESKTESPAPVPTMIPDNTIAPEAAITAAESKHVTDFVIPMIPTVTAPAPQVQVAAPLAEQSAKHSVAVSVSALVIEDDSDIAELPTGEVTESAVLTAIMRKPGSGLAECPVRPPACPEATLAVGRDRRLVLLAVARKGLTELRAINQAYRWVIENRPLLSMALPQFAIDTHAMPSLRLIVDRADAHTDLLLPMTQNGNVTVQTYRKLRWAGKTGLLLEAA